MLFVVKHVAKHCNVEHFSSIKHVFIQVSKLRAQWLHQKLSVVQLQKKLHVHEKEMQQQKLQHEKVLQQDVDVVQQQKDLQGEELLAERLQELLAERLQEELLAERLQVLLAERLQEKLLEDLLHEEEDVNRLSFFFQQITRNETDQICA